MDNVKKIEAIRKRNVELNKQLDDMKFKLEFNEQLNMNGYKEAKDLIVDLENIKQKWLSTIDDLNNKRIEYDKLISELQEIKKIMVSMGFKIPWYKRIINKFKKIFNK